MSYTYPLGSFLSPLGSESLLAGAFGRDEFGDSSRGRFDPVLGAGRRRPLEERSGESSSELSELRVSERHPDTVRFLFFLSRSLLAVFFGFRFAV